MSKGSKKGIITKARKIKNTKGKSVDGLMNWMFVFLFDVGRSMLDVRCSMLDVRLFYVLFRVCVPSCFRD
ncbi:MAG: hypothetical protein DRP37_05220 [Thermodesulfobacteriota bacterium]|nr:MAG: hypothetical protein DRP37_05220 [Thermodesulfobacteriota bacterium]